MTPPLLSEFVEAYVGLAQRSGSKADAATLRGNAVHVYALLTLTPDESFWEAVRDWAKEFEAEPWRAKAQT